MTEFLQELNSDGVIWFLPHSGESLRGEWFEGFIEHAEIHACKENGVHFDRNIFDVIPTSLRRRKTSKTTME